MMYHYLKSVKILQIGGTTMDINIFSTFSTNLRRLIDSRGITIKDFCIDAEIPAPTISRYLTGEREPKLTYIIKICDYFNVSIDWMFGVSEDKVRIYPEEIQKIAALYSVASPDDRKVVQAVLRKYDKE